MMENNSIMIWQKCLEETTSQAKNLEVALSSKRRKIQEFNHLLNDVQYRILYDHLPECAILDIIYKFANVAFCQKCKDYYPHMWYCLSCAIPTINDLEYDNVWHYLKFPIVCVCVTPYIIQWEEEDDKLYFLHFCLTHNPDLLHFEDSAREAVDTTIQFYVCRSFQKRVYIIFAIGKYPPSIKRIRQVLFLRGDDFGNEFQNWSHFKRILFNSS